MTFICTRNTPLLRKEREENGSSSNLRDGRVGATQASSSEHMGFYRFDFARFCFFLAISFFEIYFMDTYVQGRTPKK